MSADTIAAIATAVGGGVGIIRISGPRAEAIGRALAPLLPDRPPSHRLHLVTVCDPRSGELLDEVLAVLLRGPRSYTGEDTVELHAHGGAANLQRLLGAVLAAGARLATPGEFTRRAFEAGKLELSQVEAVAALIGARDEGGLRAAHRLRAGALGQCVDGYRRAIVAALADLEGALDFPEDTAEDTAPIDAAALRVVAHELSSLARSFRRPLGVVPEVVLLGRVNAGKSSLLNALVGTERALVDEAEGTTRDLVEAELDLDGLVVRLVDTAGEREAESSVEARGQALARARRKEAALALVVVDAERGAGDLEAALLVALRDEGIPTLTIENKLDRAAAPPSGLAVSAKTGAGIPALRTALRGALEVTDEERALGSARQAEALRDAADAVTRGADALQAGAAEVTAVELRRALHHLGQITGETVSAEVLDAIFSRFCIGK